MSKGWQNVTMILVFAAVLFIFVTSQMMYS